MLTCYEARGSIRDEMAVSHLGHLPTGMQVQCSAQHYKAGTQPHLTRVIGIGSSIRSI